MGRPKAAVLKKFKDYDKLHTVQTKMMSGVTFNTLLPIKETKEFFVSCEVWAYCASKFKKKKKNVEKLEVNIPILKDAEAIEFLNKHAWNDKDLYEDETEASEFLKRLYPNHKFVYFYELDYLLGAYIQGSLISYDEEGNVEEPTERDLKQRGNYTRKYHMFFGVRPEDNVPHIAKLFKAYRDYNKEKLGDKYDDKENTRLYGLYADAQEKYLMENNDLTELFITLAKHGVCLPMYFTNGTADWYKEKYGKTCAYAHAGEVFFIPTEDTVYLNVRRHF